MSNPKIIGWDIGGAHLKAVVMDANGSPINFIQLPCALWRGLAELENAATAVLNHFELPSNALLHAVTMTGELVDLFPNRHTGVCEIATCAAALLGQHTVFYAANAGFVQLARVEEHTAQIASSNWHASASLLAKHISNALLIDIGSTTSDIIPIQQGKVAMSGLSDARRMQDDTLVYTGVVRTPIMALAQKLSLDCDDAEIETNVAAEFFATMADVYRLTDELPSISDMAETADGKGKSQQESARRLARMVGCDLEDKPIATWVKLAFTCRKLQIQQLKLAVLKHLQPNMLIIGAGAGSFLAKTLADELACEYRTLDSILAKPFLRAEAIQTTASTSTASQSLSLNHAQQANLALCFPAYAVACLALHSLSTDCLP